MLNPGHPFKEIKNKNTTFGDKVIIEPRLIILNKHLCIWHGIKSATYESKIYIPLIAKLGIHRLIKGSSKIKGPF